MVGAVAAGAPFRRGHRRKRTHVLIVGAFFDLLVTRAFYRRREEERRRCSRSAGEVWSLSNLTLPRSNLDALGDVVLARRCGLSTTARDVPAGAAPSTR